MWQYSLNPASWSVAGTHLQYGVGVVGTDDGEDLELLSGLSPQRLPSRIQRNNVLLLHVARIGCKRSQAFDLQATCHDAGLHVRRHVQRRCCVFALHLGWHVIPVGSTWRSHQPAG